jgi:hypothetical protein
MSMNMKNLDALFDDKRVLCLVIACWTTAVSTIFVCIMIDDNSPFLSFGPNPGTVLFGFKLDTWTKWGCIAIYTFVSTCIADFTCDSVGPFVTNTIQDHKNLYIPYSKTTCVLIVQVFAVYAIVMNTIGLFVALSQVDFMMIRMGADLMVNYYTCNRFMRYKSVNAQMYDKYMKSHSIDGGLHVSEFCGRCSEIDARHDGREQCMSPRQSPRARETLQQQLAEASAHAKSTQTCAVVHAPSSDLMQTDAKQDTAAAEEYMLHSPVTTEHDTAPLFGVSHYP